MATIPKLSILTPAVWTRPDTPAKLADRVASLAGAEQVEHLVLFDDKKRTIGAKRQALLQISRGDYIAFVDDDDWEAKLHSADLSGNRRNVRIVGNYGPLRGLAL